MNPRLCPDGGDPCRPRFKDVRELDDHDHHDGHGTAGLHPARLDDAASLAAQVITEQALSIFQAVEARTSEIDAHARRRAEEIVRQADAAATPAIARLEALSRDLEALSTELDRTAEQRAARRARGG
jgi:hypothetical protein